MMKIYLLGRLDQNGKPLIGTFVEYPDDVETPDYPPEYTHEVTEEIWLNQHRARLVDDEWILEPEQPVEPQPHIPTQVEEIAQLKADKEALYQQLAQINTDFAAFMDFYFTQNP